MKKKIIALSVLLLLLGAGFFAFKAAPQAVEKILELHIQESCPSCKIKIGRIGIWFWPAQMSAHGLELNAGTPDISQVLVRIGHLTAYISPWDIFKKEQWKIDKISIQKINFILNDGDGHSPPKKASAPEKPDENKFLFQVDRTEIHDGRFIYTRTKRGVRADLTINDIEAQINKFGNTPILRETLVEGNAQARIEDSGGFDLKILTYLFLRPPQVKVELEVRDQNLADLTHFFSPNAGLRFQGLLMKGKTQMSVKNNELEGWVLARFKDFKLDFETNSQRSGTAAFFMNLGASIAMDQKNSDDPLKDQIRSIKIKRDDESLVSFILRGMKEAALKVTIAPKKEFKKKPF